ncbi:glycosyltransferase [Paenibacillus sp. OK076]|uniref:glycosyltransferase n=1 Tax=Paenibacillus sp. OK076 TaxID=1884379 RepID=UPI00210A0BD4|nr:glycosyltransferase [Paenibacillus sp. OK076]
MMLDPKKRRQHVNGPMVHKDIRSETTHTLTEAPESPHAEPLETGDKHLENALSPLDIRSETHQRYSTEHPGNQDAVKHRDIGQFREPFSVRRVRKSQGNKLTAMLQVRNERGRYLEEVLDDLSEFVDEIVIVDDASTDGTPDICRAYPKVVRLEVLEKPLFAEEWRLRNALWQAAAGTSPDWLLSVDADELYSTDAKKAIRALINQDHADWIAFRFYDMWGGRTHYREDDLWGLHRRHTASLVRYMPGYPYFYPQQNHHVPRLPLPCTVLPGISTELKVQHLGWAGSLEDRVRKYLRYKRIDPHGEWGSLEHYESILDPEPRLIPWKEEQ